MLGALARFEAPGFGVDLGCGQGRDTFAMLQARLVRARDRRASPRRSSGSRARAGEPRLETQVASFAEAQWPEADLVNAGYALPFCPPAEFDGLWERLVASVRPGGRFSGQLFGDRDEWAGDDQLTFVSRDRGAALLEPFELERFDEEDEDGKTALGDAKHWHVFHVVARRAAEAMRT